MPRTTRTARAGSRSRWTPCWRGTCRSARSASCSGTTRCGSTAASRRRRASPLRLVHECIRAGLAGIRIDDQPIEGKRSTQSPGIEVVSRDAAVERYQAAASARDELDPSFVIMAQCYARDAVNGGLGELLERLNLYLTRGRADWVQFESPHSVAEVRQARAAVSGTLSVMQGKLPKPLTLSEHFALGLRVAWYTFLPDQV